jgi:hypothetical protein
MDPEQLQLTWKSRGNTDQVVLKRTTKPSLLLSKNDIISIIDPDTNKRINAQILAILSSTFRGELSPYGLLLQFDNSARPVRLISADDEYLNNIKIVKSTQTNETAFGGSRIARNRKRKTSKKIKTLLKTHKKLITHKKKH